MVEVNARMYVAPAVHKLPKVAMQKKGETVS